MSKSQLQFVEDFKSKVKDFQEKIKESNQQFFKEFCEELKKFEGLKSVVIQGYTPSFNDGDPCTHRQQVRFINGWNAPDYDYSEENDEEGQEGEEGAERYIHADDVADIIMIAEDFIHQIYNTNFEITIKLIVKQTRLK